MFSTIQIVLALCTLLKTCSSDIPADSINVFFYNGSNSDNPVDLQTANLTALNIDPTKDIKFLIHGWMASANTSTWYSPITDTYLQEGRYVLAVDWSKYTYLAYQLTTTFVSPVATLLANLIVNVYSEAGVPLQNIHIIGHSLGAHIAGIAGDIVSQTLGEQIARATGLDPAGPSYEVALPQDRLDKTDAKYVDVLHTNAGGEGITYAVGDVDFWPNGGALQTVSCANANLSLIECDHNIAPWYWLESITSNDFVGTQCSSYINFELGSCKSGKKAIMGEDADQSATGNYYFNTNPKAPYAQG